MLPVRFSIRFLSTYIHGLFQLPFCLFFLFADKVGRIDILKKSLDKNDFESIAVEGHSIKGSGTMYNVEEIAEAGKNLELYARENNKAKVTEIINEMEKIQKKIWPD
jgi:HPt (histidine-containing phosphotransfer) domain-containing protein